MKSYHKKATLLIRNIHKLYTMNNDSLGKPQICKQAFLAVHHDKIMDCGVHEYRHLIDKDTRIVEGNHMIVVPGFIDCGIRLYKDKKQMSHQDHYRCASDHLYRLSCSGVTSVLTHAYGASIDQLIELDFFHQLLHKGTSLDVYSCMHMEESKGYQHTWLRDKSIQYVTAQKEEEHFYMKQGYRIWNMDSLIAPFDDFIISLPKSFCLSSGMNMDCDDLLLCARLLYRQGISAQDILASMTINPALAMHNNQIGMIAKERQADFILFQGDDIDEVFAHMGNTRIEQIYKAGIKIYR